MAGLTGFYFVSKEWILRGGRQLVDHMLPGNQHSHDITVGEPKMQRGKEKPKGLVHLGDGPAALPASFGGDKKEARLPWCH